MRKFIVIAAKLSLSAGLIWFAFSKLDAKSALALIATLPTDTMILGLVLLASQFVLVAIRLGTLLASIGPGMKFGMSLDAVMIGAFFSQTLISFVGGDAMRIWRMTRNRVPVGDATRAVLYDRVFGFLGLIALIVLGLPVLFRVIADPRVHAAILTLIAIAVVGCVFLLSLHRLPSSWRTRRVFAFAARISDMGHELVRNPARLALLLAISVGVQALNVLSMYVVARGLGVKVELTICLALIPPVMILSMMPISFAGWGVRESAMVAALSAVGVPASQSLALSISYGLGLVLVSLPGGLLWLMARRPHPGAADPDAPKG